MCRPDGLSCLLGLNDERTERRAHVTTRRVRASSICDRLITRNAVRCARAREHEGGGNTGTVPPPERSERRRDLRGCVRSDLGAMMRYLHHDRSPQTVPMSRSHWVYILTNQSGCFYVGMTSDLSRRWWEHVTGRAGVVHTSRYHLTRLVYARECPDRQSALRHERTLKRLSRRRKWAVIHQFNPTVRDWSVEWGWREPPDSSGSRPAP